MWLKEGYLYALARSVLAFWSSRALHEQTAVRDTTAHDEYQPFRLDDTVSPFREAGLPERPPLNEPGRDSAYVKNSDSTRSISCASDLSGLSRPLPAAWPVAGPRQLCRGTSGPNLGYCGAHITRGVFLLTTSTID